MILQNIVIQYKQEGKYQLCLYLINLQIKQWYQSYWHFTYFYHIAYCRRLFSSHHIRQTHNINQFLMYQDCYLQQYDSFSTHLLYSLTLDSHILKQTKHIYHQTDLMEKIMSDKKPQNLSFKCLKTVTSGFFQPIDASNHSSDNSEQPSMDLLECVKMKSSQYVDFKLKRAQQQNQILQQVQKKCSEKCFLNVKNMLQKNKKMAQQLKKHLNQIAANNKLGDKFLKCQQENITLKKQQVKILKSIKASEADKQNLKSQQQRLFKKQAALLKRQHAVVMKQKKMLDLKKKVQSISDMVSKDVSGVVQTIEQYKQKLNTSVDGSTFSIVEQAKAVNASWQSFSRSLQSKLEI